MQTLFPHSVSHTSALPTALKDGLQRVRPAGHDHAADVAALRAKFTKKQEKAATRAGINLNKIMTDALPSINK